MINDLQNGGFGIYLHWPFCESKCPYCDFNSHVRKEINHRQWLLGYLKNIENWKKKIPHSKIQSVYFGGGTPSLMNPSSFSIILDNLYINFLLSVDIEISDSALDRLLLSGISPASIYIGKTIALYVQLIILEVGLFIVMLVLFDMSVDNYPLIVASTILTTLAISSSGTLYGVIASGVGVRETLLPVLFLPVLAPAVIGATRAYGDAFGRVNADGWAWLGLLSVIAIVYTLIGMLTYGKLLEET